MAPLAARTGAGATVLQAGIGHAQPGTAGLANRAGRHARSIRLAILARRAEPRRGTGLALPGDADWRGGRTRHRAIAAVAGVSLQIEAAGSAADIIAGTRRIPIAGADAIVIHTIGRTRLSKAAVSVAAHPLVA